MRCGKLGHLPRPYKHNGLIPEIPEYLFCKLNSGKTHGHGRCPYLCLGAHPFCRGKRLVEKFIYDNPRGIVVDCEAVGILCLPQYLGFSHNHAVKARRHPEKVLYGSLPCMRIEMFIKGFKRNVMGFRKKPFFFPYALFNLGINRNNLHPVAVGKYHSLVCPVTFNEFFKGIAHYIRREGELLPYLYRGGSVVKSYDYDVHVFSKARQNPFSGERFPAFTLKARGRLLKLYLSIKRRREGRQTL